MLDDSRSTFLYIGYQMSKKSPHYSFISIVFVHRSYYNISMGDDHVSQTLKNK